MYNIAINPNKMRGKPFHTNSSKLVWFCLLRDVNSYGFVYTSALGISKEIGVNEKTVRNVLKSFCENGLIEYATPNECPILSPKKVRYMGCIIKLKNIGVCKYSETIKVRKKSDIHSDIKSDKQKTTKVEGQKDARDGFERFRDYFNSTVAGTSIPQIIKLTDTRKNALRSIFNEYGKEKVEVVLQKAIASEFLSRTWGRASFDWIFKKANFIKILEGNYDNGTISPRDTTSASASNKAKRDRGLALANQIVSQSPDILGLYDGVIEQPDDRQD